MNFRTNPQGDVNEAVMSLDEAEMAFVRKPEALAPELLSKLAGSYETPTGTTLQVTWQAASGAMALVSPGASPVALTRVKGTRFRPAQFGGVIFEFVVKGGVVKGMKQKSPGGEYLFPKK